VQPIWKTVWKFLKKLKIDLPCNPAIPFLAIYLKKCMPEYNGATCVLMFITALFIIAKLWKQPRCPTTDEWIKKMWHRYTVEEYSAINKTEIMLLAGNWMELEIVMLRKVSQVQKDKGCMISLI
jgi:hypothetical protein